MDFIRAVSILFLMIHIYWYCHSAWAEMGCPAETVSEAYDRTILHCHEFRWPYCNGILKRWHEKGLHTLAEVKAENAKEQSKPKKNTTGGNAWMKEYLNQ